MDPKFYPVDGELGCGLYTVYHGFYYSVKGYLPGYIPNSEVTGYLILVRSAGCIYPYNIYG